MSYSLPSHSLSGKNTGTTIRKEVIHISVGCTVIHLLHREVIPIAPPQRKCLHPTCRTLIPFTEGYCDRHTNTTNQDYDKSRRRNNPRYYKFYRTSAWTNTRKVALLRDEGLCQHCLRKGIYNDAEMVDHIVPVLIDWEKRIDLKNLQSLCNACHAKKTAEDKKKYG